MKKRKKTGKFGEKGSINVFVALMMVPVMVFTGVMLDFARLTFANTVIHNAASLAAASIIAYYDGLLLEVFGLLATSQNRTEAERFANAASHVSLGLEEGGGRMVGNNFNLMGNVAINNVTIGPNDERYTLANMAMLQHLLTEYMAFRIALSLPDLQNIEETANELNELNESENAEQTLFNDYTARNEWDFMDSDEYREVGEALNRLHRAYAFLLVALFGCEVDEDADEEPFSWINLLPELCEPNPRMGFQAQRDEHIAVLTDYINRIAAGETEIMVRILDIESLEEEIADLDILISLETDEDILEDLENERQELQDELQALELDEDFDGYIEEPRDLLAAIDKEFYRFERRVVRHIHRLATAADNARAELEEKISIVRDNLQTQRNADSISEEFYLHNMGYLDGIFEEVNFSGMFTDDALVGINPNDLILHPLAYNDIFDTIEEFTELYAVDTDAMHPRPLLYTIGLDTLMDPDIFIFITLEYEPMDEDEYEPPVRTQPPWSILDDILSTAPPEDLVNAARDEMDNDTAENSLTSLEDGSADFSDSGNRPNLTNLPQIPAAFSPNEHTIREGAEQPSNFFVNLLGNNVLLNEYGVQMFSNFTTSQTNQGGRTLSGIPISPQMNFWFGGELEFLIAGNYEAIYNLRQVVGRLSSWFFARNTMYKHNSPTLKSEILSLKARPFDGWGLSAAYRRFLVANETYVDIQTLLDGGRVPILKYPIAPGSGEPVQWRSGIAYGSATNEWDSTIGWYYYQYLRLMLLQIPAERLTQHIATLIELNMNHYMSGGASIPTARENFHFSLNNAYLIADVTINATVPNFFIGNPLSGGFAGDVNQPSSFQVSVTATRGY
ncbi:MAG: DUF5702 domain-containing protein [Defluviitaleaceae bacterium]|nr:DUF5702 domain-containing protein [Defluviitaleaceae bacterium]